jgi:hypothetical protein
MPAPERERLSATTEAGIPTLLEVVAGEEFPSADLRPDPADRAVRLRFRRRFPPRKGEWMLQVSGVREWRRETRGVHATETLKALRWNGRTSTLEIEGVLDRWFAKVDRLDLLLARLDDDAPPVVTAADFPPWLKEEIARRAEERAAEIERATAVKGETVRKGAAWGAGLGLVLAFLNAAPLLLGLTLVPGATALATALSVKYRLPAQAGAFSIGLPCFALHVATTGHDSMLPAFSCGLLSMAVGVAMLIGLREDESLRV